MFDLGLLFAVLVIGLIFVRVLSRAMRRHAAKANTQNFDFDLVALQKLVDNGQMTQEEFRRARDVILSRIDARHEPVKGFPVLGPPEAVRGFPVLPPQDQNEPPKTQ